MGFWDREVRNGFDEMFDFNRDGYLDRYEQTRQFDFIEEEMNSGSGNEDELFNSDLDFYELEDMDDDERREVLEEAEYDPDDFDDF